MYEAVYEKAEVKNQISLLTSFAGFRRFSLGSEGLIGILDDLPLPRAPAVTAPPEGP